MDLGRRSERKPTKPIPLIPRERFVMIVSRSSGWLSRHGKPLLRSYEWHPAVVSPSLLLFLAPSFSLSFGRDSPIAKQRARRRARAKEKIDGEREDKGRDRDHAYNYLSFYVRELGRLSQPVVLFLASAFARSSSRALLPFSLSSLSPRHSLLRARLRAISLFSFPLLLFFLALCPLLMVGASDASAYERARDEREHERTDGRTRAYAYRKAETKCTRVNERVK